MFKAPTQTPHFLTLLDDMPTLDLRLLARLLGVSPKTVRHWARTGNAPCMAHLALFWESRWGLSVLDCDLVNRERLHRGHVLALEREIERLRAQLARLPALGAHGAANDALWSINAVALADGHHGNGHNPALKLDDYTELANAVPVVTGKGASEPMSA